MPKGLTVPSCPAGLRVTGISVQLQLGPTDGLVGRPFPPPALQGSAGAADTEGEQSLEGGPLVGTDRIAQAFEVGSRTYNFPTFYGKLREDLFIYQFLCP